MSNLDTYELLNALCTGEGISGSEGNAAKIAAELLKPYGETAINDKLGGVVFKCSGYDDSAKTLLLDAHIDIIGLTVTDITRDGFLKVAPVGGVDNRVLLAQQFEIIATASGETERLAGISATVPPHLSSDDSKVKAAAEIFIDTGFKSFDEAAKHIARGDEAVINNPLTKLLGDRVTANGLDDRAGCAALILAVDMLKDDDLPFNIALTLSTQEEVGERGAKAAAYGIAPAESIEVDVSFAKVPDESDEDTASMGSGVMIGSAPSLSKDMTKALISLAKNCGIPYSIEVMNGTTGTNADVIGLTRGGVKTATLSIPLKYMHTPVEVVSLSDIESCAKLIAEYVRGLSL